MSELLQRQEAYFLGKLSQAKNRQLSRSELMRIPLGVEEYDSLDSETAQRVREWLVEKGHIEEVQRGWGVSFKLTTSGAEYLSTLKPHRQFAPKPKPNVSEGLFPFQRAFALMQFLRTDNRQLTRSQLQRHLNVKDAREHLGFGKPGKGNSAKRAFDREKADWLIDHLLETGALRETHRGKLELTETGEEILGASDHCPDICMRLRGEDLNRLLEAARNAGADLTSDEETAATADSEG